MHNTTNDRFPDSQEENIEFDYQLDPAKPLVLLLGWVDHEGILSSLKASGRQYKKKLLDSLPKNWKSTAELFTEFKVTAVVGKVPAHVLALVVDERYRAVREKLFSAIGAVPNQIFMFEDILEGEQKDKFREEYSPYPKKEVIEEAIAFLQAHGVQILSYTTRAEVTVLAEAFLDEVDKNLIFRLYVPSGRLWAGEADRFLQLFQDYLTRVERLEVRLDQKRTEHGVVYEFHGHPPAGQTSLEADFKEFSRLMTLFDADSDAAAKLLAQKGPNATEIARLISKYSKEAKRLQLDIRHEAEVKTVAIRHRLESELLEVDPTPHEWEQIQVMVNGAIPRTANFSADVLALGSAAVTTTTQPAQITYNFRPQFIGTINGVIAEEVNGNQHFGPEHHQLMELIAKYADDRSKELETAVYEIADKGVQKVGRLRAKQKLTAFLVELGKKTGDVAFGVLQSYIEKQLGL
ncbi:hypothetical protein [Xanthomonas sacchari]|uniref:hypothetical protein n=1 Tax=Xanthomonas sacchari TaxID=56458 RepID=UPI00225E422E|nr:hypothetical protein [Xanthomonas sacchari]MCW0423701.1 hypothetical protein [Xanthomonas sacchari]